MATILKGAPVVAAMNERNALLCEQLKAKGITPTLAVVRVGEREDDLSYERGVMTRCGKVGVAVKQFVLPADATQEQLLRVLDEVNTDDGIHGCLLFRPLPKQFDDRTVRAALRPEKDIDGITDGSLAGVFTNTAVGYPPCTAQACLEILKFYNIPLSGRRAVVVGRSLVVGKPAAMSKHNKRHKHDEFHDMPEQSYFLSAFLTDALPVFFFLLAALQLRSERFLLLACLLRFCLGFFPCFLRGSFSLLRCGGFFFLTPQFFARKRFVRLQRHRG